MTVIPEARHPTADRVRPGAAGTVQPPTAASPVSEPVLVGMFSFAWDADFHPAEIDTRWFQPYPSQD